MLLCECKDRQLSLNAEYYYKKVVIIMPNTNEMFTLANFTEDFSKKFEVTDAGKGAPVRESTTTETNVLFNAVNGSADSCRALVDNDPISVINIVVTSADVHENKENENSPIINKPVAHFFTADGKHYSSLSNGIIRTVKNLLGCGIIPTADAPLTIRFVSRETKRGTAFVFELV